MLFADVVHSMDIAAAVGAERLREIMTELVNRAAEVVQRYGGTVDKFTGDGRPTSHHLRCWLQRQVVSRPSFDDLGRKLLQWAEHQVRIIASEEAVAAAVIRQVLRASGLWRTFRM